MMLAGHHDSVASVLEELASCGPFFVLQIHDQDSVARPPWRAMTELVDDHDVLNERMLLVRNRLAAASGQWSDSVPIRVAASATQFGLVGRLIAPVMALAVMTGWVLDLDLADAWWQPELGGAFPLSVTLVDSAESDTTAVANALARWLTDGPVCQLVLSTLCFSVSPKVLWGNVASAVNGAATMVAAARPALARRARTLASSLLSCPPLYGTGFRLADGQFTRRSCCLLYQTAPLGSERQVCGDCVLSRPEAVKRKAASRDTS